MPTKKKAKARRKPTPPPAPTPTPKTTSAPPGDTEIGGETKTQFVGAEDLQEIMLRAEQDRQGREIAERRVEALTTELDTANNKLRAQKPVRFDEDKVKAAAQAVQLALLMDVKGSLTPLAMQSPEAAKAVIRIQKLEQEVGPTITAATVLIQRAKALAERRRTGLEITGEELQDLLNQAERLT